MGSENESRHMSGSNVRILILEDDEKLRSVLRQVLEVEGYEVHATGTADEAITATQESSYDLVVADIRMEGKDGLEALEAIKTDQPDVRSLVITGYSTEADSIRAIRLGVSDYLTKPFRLDEFLDSINAVVARRRLELRRASEKEQMQSHLLWLSRLAAALADRGREADSLLELDQRGESLAATLDLSPASAVRVRVAILLEALRQEPEYERLERSRNLPDGVARILGSLGERWDGGGRPDALKGREIPYESRVAAALLARREELDEPGRFDPEVVRALRGEGDGTLPRRELDPTQRRGLLSLARALEEASQTQRALQAYQRVADCSTLSRERAEALLGLARLEGDPKKAEEAVGLAQDLGPTVLGRIAFRAALAHEEPRTSLKWLKLSGATYRQVGDRVGQAAAVLALDHRTGKVERELLEGSVSILLQPENRALLVESAHWLFAYLLNDSAAAPSQARLLSRIIYDAPSSLYRTLQAGKLNVSQRLKLVDFLKNAGHQPPDILLDFLSGDQDPEVRERAQTLVSQKANQPAVEFIRVRSMGPFELYLGDERVQEGDWKTRKVKFLAAWILLKAGSSLSEDLVLDQFWPDELEKGKQNLYWTTSSVRRIFKGRADGGTDPILRNLGTLSLNPDLKHWHDVQELEKLLRHARRALSDSQPLEYSRYKTILELYRGPYLEECYLDWAGEIRTRLARETSAVLEELAHHAAQASDQESAAEFAGKLTELDPCHQSAQAIAMRAWLTLERPDRVMKQFEALEQTLRLELDTEPNLELVELYYKAKIML